MRRSILILLSLLSTWSAFSQKTWTGANNNSWNDDGNWSPSGVPGSGDDVVISSGTVNLSTTPNAEIGALTMNGGTLSIFGSLTITINGSSNVGSSATLDNGGTLILNNDLIIDGTLTFDGSSIEGTGDLTINGSFDWNTSATLNGPGQATNEGTTTINSGVLKTTFINNGTVNQTNNLTFGDGSSLTNNGSYDIQGNGDISFNNANNLGFHNNTAGTFFKSSGTGQSDLDIVFTNDGFVDAQTGTIDLMRDATHTGSFISTGTGSVRFNSGTQTINSGSSISGDGITHFNGATVVLNDDISASNIELSQGSIEGSGDLTITGNLNWTSATFGNSTDPGQVIISGSMDLNGLTKTLATTMINNGTAMWTGGAILFNSNGNFTNNGSFDIQTSNDFSSGSDPHSITNNGTITKTAGAGTTEIFPLFDNTGTVSIQTSTLRIYEGTNTGNITTNSGATLEFSGSSTTFINESTGTFGGSGNVDIGGPVVNKGILSPGSSPGILTIDETAADITFDPTTTFNIEIGGTTVGTDYDQLLMVDNFTLDGTLNVSFINSFVPSEGDLFNVISYSNHTGSLANVNIEPVEGLIFSVNDAGGSISVSVASLFDYHVETISFQPAILENPNALNLAPGELSEAIPLDFQFNFFGEVKRQIYVSQNGFISFVENDDTPQSIPNNNEPNDVIAGWWTEMMQLPNGTISYSVNGQAPGRIFIVHYDGVSMDNNGTFEDADFQILLHETTGRIELLCATCPIDNDPLTQGIENSDGTKAFFLNDRNDSEFGLNSDGVAFTPFIATPISQTDIVLNFPSLTLEGTLSRSTDGTNYTTIATNIATGSSNFTDTGLDPFTEYYYTLTAGFESVDPSLTTFELKTKTLPDPFTGFTAVATSSTGVKLNWINNSLGQDKVFLERGASPDGPWIVLNEPEGVTMVTDGQLHPSTTYYYRIGSGTSFGHANYTSVVSATTFDGRIIYVNQNANGSNDGTSWENAFTDLQDALENDPEVGDEVWIAAGTYKGDRGNGDPSTPFTLSQDLQKLYGGFSGGEVSLNQRDPVSNPTILSGDINVEGDESDNQETVVLVDSNDGLNILDGLIIEGGNGGTSGEGGGIRVQSSNVIVKNCVIRNNSADNFGGGIYHSGDTFIEIHDSQIQDNTSGDSGGGIYVSVTTPDDVVIKNTTINGNTAIADGGGIYFNSDHTTLELDNAVITDNHATSAGSNGGGGIYLEKGKLNISNSKINQNTTATFGGGISGNQFQKFQLSNSEVDNNQGGLQESSGGGGIFLGNVEFQGTVLNIVNSTISNNSTSQNGGGIFFEENSTENYLNVINSTFSGNSASGIGGAMYFNTASIIASLKHVTVSNNTANQVGGLRNRNTLPSSSVTLSNSIIAGNNDSNGYPDIFGNILSDGYNIIGDIGLQDFTGNSTGDKYGDTQDVTNPNTGAEEFLSPVDPMLDGLDENFGSTQTHALQTGSPAIDMGTSVEFESATITTDQRGFDYFGPADIGAFEFIPNFAPVLDNSADLQLTTINEDDTDPDGDLLQDIGSELSTDLISDLDGPGLGMAIISSDNTNGKWQYSLDNGSNWVDLTEPSSSSALLLAIDANTRLRFLPNNDFNGEINSGLSFRAWDQSQGSVGSIVDATNVGGVNPFSEEVETLGLLVSAVNDPPVLSNPVIDQEANEDELFNLTVPVATFQDVDGDELILAVTQVDGSDLPTWLSFDGSQLSGTPANEDVGNLNLIVTATDVAGASASDEFLLRILNVNDPPILLITLGDQEATEGIEFVFTIPANMFADIDTGDELTVTASSANSVPLPDWLAFDGSKFSGTPSSEDVGSLDIAVTATDQVGAQVSNIFTLVIKAAEVVSGLDVHNGKVDLIVYPNPISNHFELAMNTDGLGEIHLSIYNMYGHLITKRAFLKTQNNLNQYIDISGLDQGVYFVRVMINEAQWIKKIVKQ